MTNTLASMIVGSAIMALAQTGPADEYVLVRDGVAKCAIVLPPDGSPGMGYGARDLAQHLKLMSGADVEVYRQESEADLPGGYEGLIVLASRPAEGEPPAGREEFWITTQPGKPWTVRIYGDGQRGAMYGCLALLQDVLGCRWFTQTISRIPKQRTIAVGPLNLHQKPSFEYREPFYWEALMDPEWIVRNRANSTNGHVDDAMGGKVRYGAFVHTMFTLVPPARYFDAHPEYFALVKDERRRDLQLCLTNPDVLQIAIAGVKQWIKDNPAADIFSVSQMDNEGACQCEVCRRVREEEGSEAGPILRFVNAVAQEIGKEYPHVLLDTLAYNYSQKPPKHEKPLPNVRVRLCIPWGCKAHRLDSPCSREAYRDLHAWGEITDQLYVWDYNTEFNDYMLLHPSLDYTKTVFGILKKTGVVGVFMQGSYQSPGGCLAELKSYLGARLMWNHELDPDEIMNEYVEGVYGEAAPAIKEWIGLIHAPFRKDSSLGLGIYDRPSAPYLTQEVLDESDRLLAKATAAATGDTLALEEVGKVRMWVDYTRIARIKLACEVREGKYTYGVAASDLDRIDRWLASIKHYQVTNIAEGTSLDVSDMLTRKTAKVDCLTLENDDLRLDILPTLGGKVARLLDKKRNVDLMLPPRSVFHKVEGGYEGYVVEEPRGDEFWGVAYDTSVEGHTLTLRGLSPAGREITRRFTLDGPKLVFRTSVRNTAAQPLPARICERPQFPLQSFGDVNIAFEKAGGGAVNLEAKDFSIQWTELSKQYRGPDLPSGTVAFGLKDTTITMRFDPESLDMLHVLNNGGLTEMINLELHCRPVTLQPGETTSFEQSWTIG